MVVYYQVLNLKNPELPNGKRAEHLKIRRPLSMTRWRSKKKIILLVRLRYRLSTNG
jgi:hypothetical protein